MSSNFNLEDLKKIINLYPTYTQNDTKSYKDTAEGKERYSDYTGLLSNLMDRDTFNFSKKDFFAQMLLQLHRKYNIISNDDYVGAEVTKWIYPSG